jgi:hypothetical protein
MRTSVNLGERSLLRLGVWRLVIGGEGRAGRTWTCVHEYAEARNEVVGEIVPRWRLTIER